MPSLDIGAMEIVEAVPADGEDGLLVHQQRFGAAHGGEARGGVGGVCRLAEQVLVDVAVPAAVVVAAAPGPEVEEGGGVEVVADPAGMGDVVVQVLLGGDVGAPVLVLDVDQDAEVLLPHGLDGFGRGAGGGAGDQDRIAGEALAAGKSGLGEQLAGGLGIETQHRFRLDSRRSSGSARWPGV